MAFLEAKKPQKTVVMMNYHSAHNFRDIPHKLLYICIKFDPTQSW